MGCDNDTRRARLLRNLLLLVLPAGAALVTGIALGRWSCGNPEARQQATDGVVTVETFTDTLRTTAPAPVSAKPAGSVTARLPLSRGAGKGRSPRLASPDSPRSTAAEAPADVTADVFTAAEPPDSAEVEIPITRSVYADSLCRLVVSGYGVTLDTLEVYPSRRVVTVKKPPKRWHLGISAGYALTPRGLQPYVGIGVTYSILDF